jgi:hypothetical protein
MIQRSTIVALVNGGNSMMAMFTWKIPLITKMQMVKDCPCGSQNLVHCLENISTRHRREGGFARCIKISVLDSLVQENSLECVHRANCVSIYVVNQ